MYLEERLREIIGSVRADGRVDVSGLAARFGVTAETIRRDLTTLERRGLVRRVHGGAIPVERLGFEPGVAARDSVQAAEKDRIAKAALNELPAEGALLLDAGTTTSRLAQLLPTDRELTVITHALPIAVALAPRPNITLLSLGGRIRRRTQAAVDAWPVRLLADLYVDVAFVGTNGISVQRGLTTPDTAEAAVKRAIICAARRSIVIADHTKIGIDHLVRFGNVHDIDMLITDTAVADDLVAEIEETGVRVVLA